MPMYIKETSKGKRVNTAKKAVFCTGLILPALMKKRLKAAKEKRREIEERRKISREIEEKRK